MYNLAIFAAVICGVSTQASFGRWPGTKWCGLGTDATSFDDLAEGTYREVDKCCRTHDNCDKQIEPFQAKYGTFNLGLVTIVECECDRKFYDCLKSQGDKDMVANGVGLFYFDKLVKKCFSYNDDTDTSKILQTSSWSDSKWKVPTFG